MAIMDQFKIETDSVYRFLSENAYLIDDESDTQGDKFNKFFLDNDDFYGPYKNWAEKRGVAKCGDATFKKRANAFWNELYAKNGLEFNPEGRTARCRTSRGNFRGVRGVKLRCDDLSYLYAKNYAVQEDDEN